MPEPSRFPVALVVLIAICVGAGGLGAFATASSVETWYRTLAKPTWTPPDGLFGPVWTVLYVMMAVAAWLVWRRLRHPAARPALALFAVQLLLNVAWSFAFFGLRNPGLALVNILLLWLALVGTLVWFLRVDGRAAALLGPYLAWVSFAVALNASIVSLNA